MIAALRDAGTPEAQAALREVLAEKNLDQLLRGLTARDLSHVRQPTPETVAFLEKLQSDPQVGVQATYGLGSNIHNLEKTNPALAASALQGLTSDLTSAKSDGRRAILLTALGNAGQAESLDEIEPMTSSPATEVRAAAAQALRRIPGERAEGLLSKLARDVEGAVRFSAIDAISERSPTPALAKVVADLAVGDPVFKARHRAAGTAAGWLRNVPELRPVLETIAANDEKEDIRRIARLALDQAGVKI